MRLFAILGFDSNKYHRLVGHNVPKTYAIIGHNYGHNCLNCFSFVNDKINSSVNLFKIVMNTFLNNSFSRMKQLQNP